MVNNYNLSLGDERQEGLDLGFDHVLWGNLAMNSLASKGMKILSWLKMYWLFFNVINKDLFVFLFRSSLFWKLSWLKIKRVTLLTSSKQKNEFLQLLFCSKTKLFNLNHCYSGVSFLSVFYLRNPFYLVLVPNN